MPRQGKLLQNNIFNRQKRQILEAIAKYKSQKQRPSQERIIRELQNRYGATEKDILEHLKALVGNGDVVRVTDRGQVSYRDASLLLRKVIEKTKDYRCFVKEALDNVSYDVGATTEEIEKYVKDKCGGKNIPQTDLSAHTNAALNKMEASKKVIKEGVLYKLVGEPHSEPPALSSKTPGYTCKLEAETEGGEQDKSQEPPTKKRKDTKPSSVNGSCSCILSKKGKKDVTKHHSSCSNFFQSASKVEPYRDPLGDCKIRAVTSENNGDLTDTILKSISKIKGQRQRASEDRIVCDVQRRYDLPRDEISQQLKFCVKSGRVLEILHKGEKTYKASAVEIKNPNISVQENLLNSKKETCNPKFVTRVLNAIAKFKNQKQKASEERVSRELQTRHGLSKEQVSAQLKMCVREGKVLRILRDGEVSYKNPLTVKNTSVYKANNIKPQKYEKQILRTIAKNRSQRQRSSEEKISRELQRLCGLTKLQACKELRRCVKQGKVLKVVFRGQTSYRMPTLEASPSSSGSKAYKVEKWKSQQFPKHKVKQPPSATKMARVQHRGASKNKKFSSSPGPCNGCGKKACYSCTKEAYSEIPLTNTNASLQGDSNSDSSRVKTDECSPFVVIPIPGTLVTLDEDEDPPGDDKAPTVEDVDPPVKIEIDSGSPHNENSPNQQRNHESCEKTWPVKQEPVATLTCSSPLNCSANCPKHHKIGHREGASVSNQKQKNWDVEGKMECDSDEESSSSSSSSEESGSDEEEEKTEEMNACKNSNSCDNRASNQLRLETNGVNVPSYKSTFQREWRQSSEPLPEFALDADLDVPSSGNISPSFGVYQEMNPVVDFPDTDSTALIKELCAEVFSIEVPGNPDLVSDDD